MVLRLMAVTDGRTRDPVLLGERAAAALRGGATCVQLRLKDAPPGAMVALARELVARLPAPLIVNDRVDVALAAGAAGVHLGADDLPVGRVRSMVPTGFLVGASVGSLEEAERAAEADYWGIGPWRATGSKPDAGPPIDRDLISTLIGRAGPRPSLVIGGVRPEDLATIRALGATGVAVVSGIFGAADVAAAARSYRAAWEGTAD